MNSKNTPFLMPANFNALLDISVEVILLTIEEIVALYVPLARGTCAG
jgi:hypothetical protein